jgi:hypothetical protein
VDQPVASHEFLNRTTRVAWTQPEESYGACRTRGHFGRYLPVKEDTAALFPKMGDHMRRLTILDGLVHF